MGARRWLRPALVVVGLAVSAVFTFLAVRSVELDLFWAGLKESNYWWVVPSLAVLAASVVVKALRWRLLFPAATRPPLAATTRALLIGYFFNNILPARAGEAVRVLALHREAKTSRAEALATAVSERVYDILALLVLLFAASPFLPAVTWLRSAAVLAVLVVAATLAAFVVLARYGERPVAFVLRPLALVPGMGQERLAHAATSLTRGLSGLHSPRLAAKAFAVTVASWLLLALSFWLLMPAFSLELGFGAAVLVVVAINLALVIPSSPAAVGVFEAATLVALTAYGVGHSRALAYAVVLHAVNFFPYVAAGLVLVHRHTVGLRQKDVSRPEPA
jgi:glycosyltransferase 2 family protein